MTDEQSNSRQSVCCSPAPPCSAVVQGPDDWLGLQQTRLDLRPLSFGMLAEDCPAGDDWLPPDGSPPPPPVRQFTPPPHPDTECPFYRGAYQNFLIATDAAGKERGCRYRSPPIRRW